MLERKTLPAHTSAIEMNREIKLTAVVSLKNLYITEISNNNILDKTECKIDGWMAWGSFKMRT